MEILKRQLAPVTAEDGAVKIERKFLWFPLNINGQTLWFEWANIEYVVDIDSAPKWKMNRFVPTEEIKEKASLNEIMSTLRRTDPHILDIDVVGIALQNCYKYRMDPITAINDAIYEVHGK